MSRPFLPPGLKLTNAEKCRRWKAKNHEYINATSARCMKRKYQFNKEWKRLCNILSPDFD